MFERTLVAGWGDMDFNAHMRNTAYLDKSADIRMMYFASCGFPMAEFVRLKLGPVVMKDEVEYFREFNLLDEVRVTMSLAGLSEDGSRMRIRNDLYRWRDAGRARDVDGGLVRPGQSQAGVAAAGFAGLPARPVAQRGLRRAAQQPAAGVMP